ncbi:MAG: hypothetical protein HQM09_02760 [Candidatus Riflebacteria bacterium]|nr:hypothetical protein [Candidatus Riflebacteria bacterium]
MSISHIRSLFDIVDRLAAVWRLLVDGNEDFLSGEPTAERLNPLLEQREMGFAESRHFEEELVQTFHEVFPDRAKADFRIVWDTLGAEPGAHERIFPARQALESLVESNRRVEERLKSARTDLNEKLKQNRRAGRILRSYTQADPMGSCFIDKIK